ncbi:P-loop NTPase fold protein [Nocardia sp. NPDC005745]|uniref:KAP family P-loop NTPase fold protein n=1 Tax=Nocardia sp. NPDC005745 TaxID=3157061 RepID=UPI0033CE239F
MSNERTGPENGSDTAISTMSEDHLSRAVFADRIAQRIARTGTGPSVVFGLAGPWGSGKTSMLNMITEALQAIPSHTETPAGRWSVAYFTPWAASDIDSLITEFYTAIASALPKEATTARDLLKAAAPIATVMVGKLLKAAVDKYAPGGVDDALNAGTDVLADRLGTVNIAEDPFQVRFDKVSSAIRQAGSKVLVVVDDLDRLHTDELLAVMKAVRLLGRFPNVHYLLAYDKTTVLDLLTCSDLARDNRDRAHRYLEKIVQYPFVLPPIQRVHIETELQRELENVARNLDITWDAPATRYAVDELVNVLPDPNSLTLRSIKQLCLQTDVLCSLVGPDEIDLFDAAVITYIRLNYPDLYDRIPAWRRVVLSPRDHTTSSPNQWLDRIRAVLPHGTDTETVISIYRMLVALFPNLPHHQGAVWTERSADCRINDRDYFDRYFQFAIPEGDLSDAEVRAAFQDLLDRGELDDTSIISECLAESPQRRILLSKMVRYLGLVTSSTSTASASAAVSLTRRLAPRPGELYSDWGTVIFAILAHAVATAHSDEDGRRILNSYRDAFGLHHATGILVHYRDQEAIWNDRLSSASHDIREQVVQACLLDLRTPSVPIGEGLLSFAQVLDDSMWAQIRAALRGSGISQQDIAARFVGTSQSPSTVPLLNHFYDEWFSKLIPDDELDLDTFDNPTAINATDLTITGRQAFAAHTLRLASPPHRVRNSNAALN